MADLPKPPKKYQEFTERYPDLAKAWECIHEAGRKGPLDERTTRLVKLGISIGAQLEGATHASVRKGIRQGISRAEMEQVVALAAGTIGMPSAVAAYVWLKDVFDKESTAGA